jgi:hypothetical protein
MVTAILSAVFSSPSDSDIIDKIHLFTYILVCKIECD